MIAKVWKSIADLFLIAALYCPLFVFVAWRMRDDITLVESAVALVLGFMAMFWMMRVYEKNKSAKAVPGRSVV
jgi:uncharacterized RDD family membrane protein YckC